MVLEKLKRFMKQKAKEYQRGLEAERIYKQELSLAFAQAKREKALKLAAKGQKPKGETGKSIMGMLEMLGGKNPLGMFEEEKPKKKRKRRKRKR